MTIFHSRCKSENSVHDKKNTNTWNHYRKKPLLNFNQTNIENVLELLTSTTLINWFFLIDHTVRTLGQLIKKLLFLKKARTKSTSRLGHWGTKHRASPRVKSSQKIRPLALNGKYCPYADNKSATQTAAKHFSHGRTKHTSALSLCQRHLIERPLFFHKCLRTCSSATFLPKAINHYEFLICKLMLFDPST